MESRNSQVNGSTEKNKGKTVFDDEKGKIEVQVLKGSDYVISLDQKHRLGEGSYGSVVRSFNMKIPQEDLAAQIIPLGDASQFDSLKTELKVLQKLPHHPNLVNYRKIILSSHHSQYFILDYCNGGTLSEFMEKNKNISESQIIEFLRQFCRGYKVLLEYGIIHRDIQPENILLHNRVYKIADFGLAKVHERLKVDQQLRLSLKQNTKLKKGTPLYVAPELIQKQMCTAKVDIWSLGVLLYRMLYNGRYPFLQPQVKYDVPKALDATLNNEINMPTDIQRSKELTELVRRMLEKNENKRIGWNQLFDHQLIQDYMESKDLDELEDLPVSLSQSTLNIKQKELLDQMKFMKDSEVGVQRFNQLGQNINTNAKQAQQTPEQIQDIISNSNRRLRNQSIINKIEEYFLSTREAIHYITRTIGKLTALYDSIVKIDKEDICRVSYQQTILVLLEQGRQLAFLLQSNLKGQYHNSFDSFSNEEWNVFLASDSCKIIQNAVEKDLVNTTGLLENMQKNFSNLQLFIESIALISKPEFESLYQECIFLFMSNFQQIFKLNPIDQGRGVLVAFTYVLDLSNFSQTKPLPLNNKSTKADFLRFYEIVENVKDNSKLYEDVSNELKNLNILIQRSI